MDLEGACGVEAGDEFGALKAFTWFIGRGEVLEGEAGDEDGHGDVGFGGESAADAAIEAFDVFGVLAAFVGGCIEVDAADDAAEGMSVIEFLEEGFGSFFTLEEWAHHGAIPGGFGGGLFIEEAEFCEQIVFGFIGMEDVDDGIGPVGAGDAFVLGDGVAEGSSHGVEVVVFRPGVDGEASDGAGVIAEEVV